MGSPQQGFIKIHNTTQKYSWMRWTMRISSQCATEKWLVFTRPPWTRTTWLALLDCKTRIGKYMVSPWIAGDRCGRDLTKTRHRYWPWTVTGDSEGNCRAVARAKADTQGMTTLDNCHVAVRTDGGCQARMRLWSCKTWEWGHSRSSGRENRTWWHNCSRGMRLCWCHNSRLNWLWHCSQPRWRQWRSRSKDRLGLWLKCWIIGRTGLWFKCSRIRQWKEPG